MALTKETITANENLANLSDEQIAAIEKLSLNDEDAVIGKKTGEIHGAYDKDIKEVAGVEKQEGEKTYDYMKRVLSTFKTQAESASEAQTKLEAAQQKVADLEKAVKENATDDALKQQLKDAEDKVQTLETTLQNKENEYKKKETELNERVTSIQVDTAFEKASAGLKFKDAYTEGVQKTLVQAAKAEILNTVKPDWIDVDGTKTMVLRNKDGEILRNKNNKLEPYTVTELLAEKLSDTLDTTGKKKGTETKKPDGTPETVSLVELAGVKTQVEADDIITKYLLQKGMLRGTSEFAEEQAKIRKENEVEKLPIR